MAEHWQVEPGRSVGPVALGATRADLVMALGAPIAEVDAHEDWGIQFPATASWLEHALKVAFQDDVVTEITLLPTAAIAPSLAGRPAFDTPFDEVVARLSQLGAPDTTHPEYPCLVVFPALGIALWRSCLPVDVEPALRDLGDRSGLFVESLTVQPKQ